ncbi:unnamed protein product, partial [marine sediment metagenome]
MPKFEINQRISIKGKPGVNGRINFIPPELRGKQFYEIKLDDGTIQSFHEHQLIEEIIATDPWQMFGSNQFESYRNFGLATTLFKVENTANNTISTLKASRTLFKAYLVVKNKKKLIVFAFFKKTLKYLKIRLEDNGVKCEIIHGDIKDRTERIENFRTTPQISILLSSEVGSEGLDLQFCDALVNYDLPWNPMVVEQRIGRIDRMGQESKVINVYSFALKGTIEEKIYN